ncbi:MAG: sigma-54-dependent Fis family transcriptional regulator [Oligoflexia bacterium]|nr:sigma-54-dependent Fis family transcriptional regulator [Oligoflexia bacterium]
MHNILIVDDERHMCRSLEILLESEKDIKTLSASTAGEALCIIEQNETDLVITDLTMPGKMNGMDLLRSVKEKYPHIQVIMMTAYSTVQSAIEAIKIGAYDYLVKPFSDDDFLLAVNKAIEVSRLINENWELRQRLADMETRGNTYIAKSTAMKQINFVIERAANTQSNILITGESGTGKEVLARLIHNTSQSSSNRFIAINCASIPETLLESELFGHEKGAFSGAVIRKKGKFELAPGGVIFLDEIAEMPLSLQAKLLRVIEDKSFERLGGVEQIRFSSRIIAATNKNLKNLVDEGKFRDDLYYRLNVVHIEIPPLRKRREDISELIELFMETKSRELGLKSKSLSREAVEMLSGYDYPGNIRELGNIIESALIVSRGNTIRASDLPLLKQEIDSEKIMHGTSIDIKGGFAKLEEMKARLEEQIIKEALKLYGNLSNSELAELLGTTRRVLEARMKQYRIAKSE